MRTLFSMTVEPVKTDRQQVAMRCLLTVISWSSQGTAHAMCIASSGTADHQAVKLKVRVLWM